MSEPQLVLLTEGQLDALADKIVAKLAKAGLAVPAAGESPAEPKLVTATELGEQIHRSAKQILKWKRTGLISAAVDTGRNILFDPESVAKDLANHAKRRAPKGRSKK